MADPFLDALGLKDPTAQPSAKAPGKAPAYDPTDLAVRIAMLEDSSPEGRAAVAGVMANRAKAAKGDLLKVLTAPKAFEPWGSSQDKIAAIDPNSDEYKATAAAIVPILQGKAPDPTGGAVNFYGPESNAQLAQQDGRPVKPAFDDGSGVRIGGNLFFGGGKPAGDTPAAGGDTFLSTLGVDPGKPLAGVSAGDAADLASASGPMTIKVVNGQVVDGATGKPVPKAQVDALHALVASGRLTDQGTIDGHVVHMQRDPSDAFAPGDFYIEAGTGKLKGGPQESSALAGLGQGASDVAHTVTGALSAVLPGAQDAGINSLLTANQQVYDATHAGDLKSGVGRFTGQVLGSAPLLAGGEAAAAPLLARAGGVGAALAGEGGVNMAPGIAKFLTRAGSLGLKGAAEGAGAAGLVSSASDDPIHVQLAEGALGGALLGPLLHGAISVGKAGGGAVRDFLTPFSASGADKMAREQIAKIEALGESQVPDLTPYVHGSTPTYAQARGNAALAGFERTLRDNPLVAQVFTNAEERNNLARQGVAQEAQGDPGTVADLARARADLVDAHKARVFSTAGEADPSSLVSLIDSAAASPEAHTPEVSTALGKLRNGIVTEPDKELTPAELAAMHRAAGETFGAPADAFTPDVMDAARQRLGAKFEDIAGRTNVIVDPELTNGLNGVVHDASQVLEAGKIKPLQNLVDAINSTVKDGQISGASYKALIRRNGPLDVLQRNGDGAMRHYASQIREHLDDALERTMASDFPGDRIPQPPKPYDPNAAQASAELAGKAAPAPAAAPVLDDTDQALNLIRARKEGTGSKGPSLADALIKQGGLKDDGGELSAMDVKASYGKRGGLLQRGKGMSLDEAAQWAQERGYIGKPDLSERASAQDLLEALRKDLDGKERIYSQGPTASDAVRNHADELEEMLHEMGIDPSGMPNGRIKQKMAEYFGTTAPSTETPVASAGADVRPAPSLSPEDEAANAARGKASLAELQATRLAYKNLKTVEMALRSAGPDFKVSPRALNNAVKQNFTSYAYKGGGPLGDVAAAALKGLADKAPTFEKNPQQLFALRENLSGSIEKLTKAGETDDAARAAAAKLSEVRAAMDDVLEKSAPGYAEYRRIADSTAEPIEAQRYLQSLPLTTNGPKGGTVTLNLVNKALDRIEKGQAMPGPHPAKSVSAHTIMQLQALKADLEREAARDLGRARGSETYQKAATAAEAAGINVPLMAASHVASRIPLVSSVARAAEPLQAANNARVMRALANRMVNPEPMPELRQPGPGSRVGQVVRRVAATLPAGAGGILGSRLLGK